MTKKLMTSVGVLIATASAAHADQGSHAAKGSKEIAVESILIVGHQSQNEVAVTQVTALGGLSFRYFMAKRMSVGVSLGGFYRTGGPDESDSGAVVRFIGSAYLPLAKRFFIAPTLGLGGMFGSRRRPLGGDMVLSRSLVGGAFSAALPFVLYTRSRFDVRAGPELLATLGSVAAPISGGETDSFVTVDAGFSVGISWTF